MEDVFEICSDKKRIWFTNQYGGVRLSEYLHMACMLGSKTNIHVGSCGGLNLNMESLDFVVPTWTWGNESATRMYDRDNIDNRHYSDPILSNKLVKLCSTYKVHTGPVMTCGAMLGETEDDVKKWSAEGYFAVEMETSTVFAVSKHFNVPASCLMYVTDNLIKGQTVGDASHVAQREEKYSRAQYMYDIVLEVMLS